MKVVLDTNVVISAGISSDGNPAKIFELFLLEKIINYTTYEIIREIENVMQREKITKILSVDGRKFVLENFKQFSILIKPTISINKVEEDPDDDKFLECAISANIDYIISGDEHLLKLKEFRGIYILNPTEFLEKFFKKIL
jgi:uncharacterized protein